MKSVISAVITYGLFVINQAPSYAQSTPLHPETGEPLTPLPLSTLTNGGSMSCSQEFFLSGDFSVPGDCSLLSQRLFEEQVARDFPENGPVGWRGGACMNHTIDFASDGSYFQSTFVPLFGGGTTHEYTGTYTVDSSQLLLNCETSVFFAGGDRSENSCVGFNPSNSFYYLPAAEDNSQVHGITAFGEYVGNDILIYNPTNPEERIACSTSPITLQAAVEAATSSNVEATSSDNDAMPVSQENCDYSAAEFNNGWGWNQITGESCPPLQAEALIDSDCDYTDATINDGWGWNPVTQMSCRPR